MGEGAREGRALILLHMGRYFSIQFPVGAPEPPLDTQTNGEDRKPEPMRRREGWMSRFAIGITYSNANGAAFSLIEQAGYALDKMGNPVTMADPDKAARFPNMPLVTKFFINSEMTWTKEECVLIARDIALLVEELRAEVDEEVLDDEEEERSWIDEYNDIPVWVDTPEEDAETRARHAARVDTKMYKRHGYELMFLSIFQEAVFRGGEVETN